MNTFINEMIIIPLIQAHVHLFITHPSINVRAK